MDATRSRTLETSVDDPNRRFFQPDIETMPRDRLRAMQEKRVLELVPAAYENSPFYRELWSAAGVDPARVGVARRALPSGGGALPARRACPLHHGRVP